MFKKLKNVRRDTRDYDPRECCVSGCSRESDCIVASKKLSKLDLPLCEIHWGKYCQLTFERNETNECKECKEARDKEAIQEVTKEESIKL